ncbi:hypothetical protein AZA_02972 [Nitrospirillum viridazoti Y2]|uniref:Uncharacterized protein n=1 Tax=Nitrospirillum amazonense TaxID=28077 RepID=A0A560IC57_9PROT|nr:hypothetical protein [Nitrospirillum amazonense]EGY00460.1 hypothetical protein AZA_02972 [Nitrospirillum amazonense Y2]TWB56618.1 hypothetical protein FBZ92_11038 [Nitrospirillum amazonense]
MRSLLRTTARLTTIASVGLLLAACGDSNPVLGKWEISKAATEDQQLAAAAFGATVEFTAGSMIPGNGMPAAPVTYKHDGDTWFIVLADGRSFAAHRTKDDLTLEVPMFGATPYVKAKG